MAENYSLNSGFGFNVTSKGAKTNENNANNIDITESTNDLFNLTSDYGSKYDSVFSGDVAREINMYSRQALIVGMNLKAADTNIRKFDMNI